MNTEHTAASPNASGTQPQTDPAETYTIGVDFGTLSGRAVVVSSEDPAALAAVCDRVVAVRAGRIVGTVGAAEAPDSEPLDTRAVIEAMGGLA